MSSEKVLSQKLLGRWVSHFEADKVSQNYSRHVSGVLHSLVLPSKVSCPQLLLYSSTVADALGFSAEFCASDEFVQCMAGNQLLPGSQPFATRYGGHQFGTWAGQLGDGRAINLGELAGPGNDILSLQLKGAGPTPYSRGADGRAVLRSSVREFLCSEAMHFLGIPSTRALSLVETGDAVVRDMFYDGNVREEPGAIVCRVAPSFTRFGHFQLCAMKGELTLLEQLVEFTIATDFPELNARHLARELDKEALYLEWFREVSRRTLAMLLGWMRVGFVHGVLNTDNMSILGLTIDYGPYGWLDSFDLHWTPNTTDSEMHRYEYGQQPVIVQWNLYQLANAVLPVIGNKAALEQELMLFANRYENQWRDMMLRKIGLESATPDGDDAVIGSLMELLLAQETDMSIFFRRLAEFDHHGTSGSLLKCVEDSLYDSATLSEEQRKRFDDWQALYTSRLMQQASSWEERKLAMNATNPWFVLRNYLTQEAIEKAQNKDYSMLHALHEALQNPYEEDARFAEFVRKRPDWARNRAGCSMLSCSS